VLISAAYSDKNSNNFGFTLPCLCLRTHRRGTFRWQSFLRNFRWWFTGYV